MRKLFVPLLVTLTVGMYGCNGCNEPKEPETTVDTTTINAAPVDTAITPIDTTTIIDTSDKGDQKPPPRAN